MSTATFLQLFWQCWWNFLPSAQGEVACRFAISAAPPYVASLQMPGMVNVVNKSCEHQGCVKRPSFNFPNIRPARFCGQVSLFFALIYAIFSCTHSFTASSRWNGLNNDWIPMQTTPSS
jgi:hypothetical protein